MKFKSGLANSTGANLGRALAFSLALHGLLLWLMQPTALPSLALELPQASYLSASLSRHAATATPAVSPAPEETRPSAIQAARAAEALPLIPPGRAMALAGRSIGSSGNAPADLGAGDAAPSATVSAGGIDLLPAGATVDANGLRQYRLSLAAAARRFKHYPLQAQENGWRGTAEVSLAIAANGVPQPPQLLRSSGHSLLDAAALDMIGNAALRTAVPTSLHGQSFSVPVPVEFNPSGE